MSNMTSGASSVTIFCRTYDKDVKWLERALPTWLENCRGYSGIVVVGIPGESEACMDICARNGVRFKYDHEAGQIESGYINQQYTKLTADRFTASEYVLFVDSDTLCYHSHIPDSWFTDGKPDMLYTPWKRLGDANCWKTPTRYLLGIDPPYEFMRRLPLFYPLDVVKAARQHAETIHGLPLLQILQNMPSLSEFNAIGAYAWFNAHDKFNWIDTEREILPPNPFRQYWSHGDMEEQLKQ